jgi:hypothetical protein
MSSLDLHNLYEQCAAFQEDEFTVLEVRLVNRLAAP